MKWNLERRKIKQLKEFAKNARRLSKHDAAHLEESLSKFGQCEPIVISQDNVIIGGHQRLRTLRKMGYKEVDVYVSDTPLDEKEIEELNIRLNRNAGEWDWDVLANDWDQVDLSNYGFTDSELFLGDQEGQVEEEKKKNKCSMAITFATPEDLQEAENRIATIVTEYPGAHYKVR